MGSNSSDDPDNNISGNNNDIDASVGTLVWVRRRNGSWWLGRIMGLDEISDASLISPKSGTPVQLLGRDDASVDWYNLEKSKRVKAFRCGEYDECIEKAKAQVANGNKKAVKYARREDAIIHALEIENTRLGKDQISFFTRHRNLGGELGSSAKDSSCMSDSGEEDASMMEEEEIDSGDSREECDLDTDSDSDSGSDSESNSESDSDADSGSDSESESESDSDSSSGPELSQPGISFEEPSNFVASKMPAVQVKRRRTPNDSEDDGSKGIKRMKGLQDLGVVVGYSNAGNCSSNGCSMNGGRGYNPSMKRKRSQVAHVHEFLKRKNRHRPLTKVLESTAMVPVPIMCDRLPNSNGSPFHGISERKVSRIDSNESMKSFGAVAISNSGRTGVSCENGASLNPSEQTHDAFPNNLLLKKENNVSGGPGVAENDSLFDVPFVGEAKHSTGLSPGFATSGRNQVGGWGRQSSQISRAEVMSVKAEGLNEAGFTSSAARVFNNFSQGTEKDTSEWQLKGKRNSRHISKSRKQDKRKYLSMNRESGAHLAGLEHFNGFFQGSDQRDDFDANRRPLASYNCSLPVKSKRLASHHGDSLRNWSKSLSHSGNHARENMMGVSLPPQRLLPYRQSRFTINSRYQESDFPGRTSADARLFNVKLEVKANYQPQNVPLVSLMSKLNGKAIIGRPLTVEQLADGYCDSIINSVECDPAPAYGESAAQPVNPTNQKLELGRIPAKPMAVQSRFSPRKSSRRRRGGHWSKKTRKLSSLTGNKEEYKKPVVEKSKGPVIACVPLKVVFSRINEAVNGSAQTTHCALTSSKP